MNIRRLFVILTATAVTVIILLAQCVTAVASWVKDGNAVIGVHTIQCRDNGKLEISFFDTKGKQLNFYELSGEYYVDDIDFKEEFLKEGMTDAGAFISVSKEPARISYILETFGHLELTAKPDQGFKLSRFVDSSCSCPESLDFVDGTYQVTSDSVKTIEAVFAKDTSFVKPVSGITITLNGNIIPTDVPPFIEKGRTMVPVRFIGEALGADAAWDSGTGAVTFTVSDTMIIKLKNGEENLSVEKGGETSIIPMDITAIIKDGRIFVPARFIAEAMGITVGWNAQTKTVTFSTAKTTSDSLRFKEEYEALNDVKGEDGINQYTSLTIDKDNNIVYLTYDELVDFMENKTGLLYFGRPGCPWCRLLMPYMLDFAKNDNVNIYYYNIEKDRDENNEKYKNIVSILGEHLPTIDTVTQNVSDPDFNPALKRVVLPQLFFIKDGEVKADMFMFQHEFLKDKESEKILQLLKDKYATIDCDC